MYGVKIERQVAGVSYETEVVDQLKFVSPKMYLCGILLNEILADPALVQNTRY